MITLNVIDDNIVGSYGDTPFSMPYTEEAMKDLTGLAEKASEAATVKDLQGIYDTVEGIVTQDVKRSMETACEYIKVDKLSGKFYLHYNKVTSDVEMPKALVERIFESVDKKLDFDPLIRMWVRFLRNPRLGDAGKGAKFAKKFFNFVNLKYVHPVLKKQYMDDDGLTEKVAEKRATMYQMKITNEGLLNGYKVSREVETKFEADDEGNRKTVNRYARTFNPDTGAIDSDGKPDIVEDRVFEPAVLILFLHGIWLIVTMIVLV